MASLAAGFWHRPLAVVPCMSNDSSAMVFVDGLLSHVVDWPTLEKTREHVRSSDRNHESQRDRKFGTKNKIHQFPSSSLPFLNDIQLKKMVLVFSA
jgi:hypothetical protein